MLVKKFRNDDFINRESEIEFFLDYFQKNPRRILWVYGPKSTGKTTLIEYVVENYLMNDVKYNVKYINFRRNIISNYDNFLQTFIKKKDDSFFNSLDIKLQLGFIQIDTDLYKKIQEKELDFFDGMKKVFLESSNNKKNILIIDEIQSLQDIYINGDRLLLHEFLNFCVSLTKELHISHVLILTSNTLFLNTIYQNSKLKETSEFKLINHLEYKDIEYWLTNNYQLSIFNSQLIYDYLGGSATRIKKFLDNRKRYNSTKEQLEEMAEIAENEIDFFIQKNRLKSDKIEQFEYVAKKIVKNGYFDNKRDKGYLEIISMFAEVEILFYDPIKNITTANSKIYVKAFERILS